MDPSHRRQRARRGRPASPSDVRRAVPTRARLVALRVLERVERAGAYADLALHGALRRTELAPADRALAMELVYGTLRWRGRLDFVLSHVLDKGLDKLEPTTITLLRLGCYQLLFSDRIPNSAAVDQTVRCARAAGMERATGLVNAVLRRVAREHESIALPDLETDPQGHLTHSLSLPSWLAERWLRELGADEAAALAMASNQVPPLAVRTNPRRSRREDLLKELGTRFPDVREAPLAPRGLLLGHRGHPGLDPAFLEGRYTIQDQASQLVVALLDPQPGERVLDTCAAPGGKATAIAESIGDDGEVVALDRNPRRLLLVGRDARRLGLDNVTTREADASVPFFEASGPAPFDRVLVDAPCSGLGTLRRNPDARWRVQPEDPARLAEIQRAILRNAAGCVGPGGVLVYSTCTLTTEENESVVDTFLREADGFELVGRERLPEAVQAVVGAEGLLRTGPHHHDTDGFFAARFERAREARS